ncbi:gluconate 2-dehydrogenase subunit 3 family protein [Undibacterium sp. Di24W]|uniref:gluconate 2-dehydrogenase subunit 3 family protein n=1 Tax=Undibacterium sp. Di24W TaxID=3413033 RepID=UPI003BEFA24C
MNRRELLQMVATMTGMAVIGSEAFAMHAEASLSNGAAVSNTGLRFSARDINLLDEIAETIIPKTDTPGAKAAKVGRFMEVMVRDCYTSAQRAAFIEGLRIFPGLCLAQYQKNFLSMSVKQRHEMLVSLEKEAKTFNAEQSQLDKERRHALETENKDNNFALQKEFESLPKHFYTMVKQLTLLGFFTSEIGATKTLRYVAVPGRYDGNVPYIKGQRAWG